MGFGTFGRMSSNVRDFVNIAVDYGAKHLGSSIVAMSMEAVRQGLKRRFREPL